jgi:tetratricopeptide (TPR) repeat protein
MQKYDLAIPDYTKAIELNANDMDSYVNRGSARYNANDTKGACEDWKKAKELGSKDVDEMITKFCK